MVVYGRESPESESGGLDSGPGLSAGPLLVTAGQSGLRGGAELSGRFFSPSESFQALGNILTLGNSGQRERVAEAGTGVLFSLSLGLRSCLWCRQVVSCMRLEGASGVCGLWFPHSAWRRSRLAFFGCVCAFLYQLSSGVHVAVGVHTQRHVCGACREPWEPG